MDSKRRMIEIHIWDQSFFSELSQGEKLFYWFINCKCDNVGVYRHNPKLAAFHCDGEIDLQSFVDVVNFDQKRIESISEGTLWIKDFVRDTWGTIAAKNNLGLSCYKLLVKHGLLDRFISEYPNSINIGSFREAITENQKGYGDLPLPQGSPKLDPKQGQGRDRAGTINITNNINKGINGNINNSTFDRAENILKAYPKQCEGVEFEALGLIEEILIDLKDDGVDDPESYLLNEIKKIPKGEAQEPEAFFKSILQKNEIPF